MPRQDSLTFSPPPAAQFGGRGTALALLASVGLHAVVFAAFFLAGSGGEIGVAGDGGGMEAIQVGVVFPPGPVNVFSASGRSEIAETTVIKPKDRAASAREAVPIRVEKNTAKEERNAPVKPVRPAQRTVDSVSSASAAAASSAETGQAAGGAGEGDGRGGVGNAATPGTAAGDGRPFGFSLAEVNGKPGIVRRVAVVYPREARQKHVTGRVLVRFHLDEAGAVSHLSIKNASPPGVFEENTLAAVRQWRFSPAKMGGKAVPVWVELPIEFDLRR